MNVGLLGERSTAFGGLMESACNTFPSFLHGSIIKPFEGIVVMESISA